MNVQVIGRFPPPYDGQALATRRMAEVVAANHNVCRINIEPPYTEFVENKVALRWNRVRHYVMMRGKILTTLQRDPAAMILWASISPAPLGHLRDITTVASAFQSEQPVVGVVHRSGYDALFRSVLTRASAVRLVERLSAYVFLNERESLRCEEWIPEHKRFVIPNTIDDVVHFTNREVLTKRKRRDSHASLRLLFLSNMIPLKGYLDVLEAAAVLKARGVTFDVEFVGRWGSARDRQAFNDLVEKHALHTRARYRGGVDERTQIKECYRRADVFVLPTYHPTEAQPVALIEAMSAGLPIVTTRQGGIPLMLADEDALFVAPKSPIAIADAIQRLMDENLWLYFSTRARRRFENQFAQDIVRNMWESLLEQIDS